MILTSMDLIRPAHFRSISRIFGNGSIILFLVLALGVAHSARGTEAIIFDTDMGSDCDDVGALALLHNYADEGRAEVLACIYSSGKVPYGSAIVDAINLYYGRTSIPVGATHDLTFGDPVDKMSAGKLARNQAAFGNRWIHNRETEEQTSLNRRILATQPDASVTYLTVGHTKGLYELMVSGPDASSPLDGRSLIQQKVKRWVALGGLQARNPEGQHVQDWNFFRNGTAPFTDALLEEFPVPVFIISAGSRVMTGRSLKTTPPGNIVRTAYRDWLWWNNERTLDDQRPSWDLVAVVYAIVGKAPWFQRPLRGTLHFDPEKGSLWETHDAGSHFYVEALPGNDDAFADYLNARIARPPARLSPVEK